MRIFPMYIFLISVDVCPAIFSIAIKFAFCSSVSEFLSLICVQKTVSMKILVLRIINCSGHRKCFVMSYVHSMFVSKALIRRYLARSGL